MTTSPILDPILISDLYEGGNQEEMLKRTAAMVQSGMHCISLLALSDDGAPAYNHELAAANSGSASRFSPVPRTASPTSWPRPCPVVTYANGRGMRGS